MGDGEGRAVARERVLALERVEQRALLAADVGAGAAPDVDVEGEVAAEDSLAEEAGGLGLVDGLLEDRCVSGYS